jgi:hypothetical protein
MRREAAVAAMILAAAVSCRERGRPNPEVRMAISHERAIQPESESSSGGGDAGAQVPNRLDVPPEVAAAYSGVKLAWTDKTAGKSGTIEVPLGGSAPLPDPSFVVGADVFLPAFTMGGGAITSQGIEPQNPAARITVSEGGKEIFAGWIFTRFPDVHPFTNPKYELKLEGGVPKAGK